MNKKPLGTMYVSSKHDIEALIKSPLAWSDIGFTGFANIASCSIVEPELIKENNKKLKIIKSIQPSNKISFVTDRGSKVEERTREYKLYNLNNAKVLIYIHKSNIIEYKLTLVKTNNIFQKISCSRCKLPEYCMFSASILENVLNIFLTCIDLYANTGINYIDNAEAISTALVNDIKAVLDFLDADKEYKDAAIAIGKIYEKWNDALKRKDLALLDLIDFKGIHKKYGNILDDKEVSLFEYEVMDPYYIKGLYGTDE